MLHYLITNREVLTGKAGEERIKEDGLDCAGEESEVLRFAVFNSEVYKRTSHTASSIQVLPPVFTLPAAYLPQGDVLFYIHGFRTDLTTVLEDVCALEKKYTGEGSAVKAIIALTWPARKNCLYYNDDAQDAIRSGATFARQFQKIKAFTDSLAHHSGHIHLLAHSMGNRMLEAMVENLLLAKLWPDVPYFTEVILVAPDIDWQAFENEYSLSKLALISGRITVYHHADDVALFLSQTSLNTEPRLGRHGFRNVAVIPSNVYSVDCSGVDDIEAFLCWFIDHSYHQASHATVRDIRAVLAGKSTGAFVADAMREPVGQCRFALCINS